MIADMHTHILPCIDDGAKDLKVSLEMLSLLEDDGVTDVVLTPHFYFKNQNIDLFLKKREEAFEKLKDTYNGKINLHLGAEVEFSNAHIAYSEFKKLAVDSGRYIILELPFGRDFNKELLDNLERFIYQTGLIPIIAHAERYSAVLKQPELIALLINMGCLIQVNCETVINSKKGSFVHALFLHGQAHLIGSDCHNLDSRKPNYKEALLKIETDYGVECRDYILCISNDVIKGEKSSVYITDTVKKRFGKYR